MLTAPNFLNLHYLVLLLPQAALQTDRVKELLKQYGANAKSNKDLTKLINENQELNEAIKDILANH